MRFAVAVITMTVLLVGPLRAQDDSSAEEAFDEALKNFGYTAGLAWQCSDSDGRPGRLDRTMEIYQRLTQLFGTDRAFYFAAAFGAGSVDTFDLEQCERHIADFESGTESGIAAQENPE